MIVVINVDYGQCSEMYGTNHAFTRAPGIPMPFLVGPTQPAISEKSFFILRAD